MNEVDTKNFENELFGNDGYEDAEMFGQINSGEVPGPQDDNKPFGDSASDEERKED